MRAVQRLIFVLNKNETAQSIAISISVATLLIGVVVLFLEWPVREFRAMAVTNYSRIDYDKVTCLSIDSQKVTIEGRRYSTPALASSIAGFLSIKKVLVDATYSECPWTFSVDVGSRALPDVFDGIWPAQHMVHVRICERTDDGHPNMSKCLSKSVYVFNWRVKPRDLFRIGVIGLRLETKDDEEFTVRAEHD